MRNIIISFIGLSFLGCATGPVAGHSGSETIFAFEASEGVRDVSAEPAKEGKKAKKGEKAASAGKYIAVFPCKKGEVCQPKAEDKKVVPMEKVVETVKKNVDQNQNVLGRQEKILERGVASLKQQKKQMEQEYTYYEQQTKVYKYASLKPVMDNYKRYKSELADDIKQFDSKIQQFEKDLNYLKNNKGLQLGQDSSTQKLMQMLADGQWGTFGAYLDKEDQVLWQFFQKVGQDVARN